MSSLAKYFHTLRYLRPVQIFGRLWFKLPRPRPGEKPPPALRAMARGPAAPIATLASMLTADRFLFLNIEGICSAASDWQGPPGHSKLWTYNLHYFDDLNSLGAAERASWHVRMLGRWVGENPPGNGIGWEPYPLSRRIVNWIKWAVRGQALSPGVLHSLAVQVRWLGSRLEWHLQGNHLFANAKALIFAGLYFEDAEAERWLRSGIDLMGDELAKQVLADGGHFERSPMYHAAFLEDLLDSMAMMQAYGQGVPAPWFDVMARMMDWLETMTHPDGEIAFFNDAAFGIAPNAAQLRQYAGRLGIGLQPHVQAGFRPLVSSGYIAINSAPFYLVCDVAAVGPDHLPAHAHADALSFELSIGGERIFVNSGTSEYGDGAERQRQRGTAAHNTVAIDEENSSEVWAGFRVARRSRARLLEAQTVNSTFIVVGEHDGYRRLPGRNLHRRHWSATSGELIIDDRLEGPFRTAKCYFYLHPDVTVLRHEEELHLSDSRGRLLKMGFVGAVTVHVLPSTWHPQFGVSLPNHCIVAALAGPSLKTWIRWGGVN